MANFANQATFGLADDYVPQNFDDLYKSYAPFVTRLVTRYNQVSANFEDLLQHVWLEVLKVDILTKYHSSVGILPKMLTADQTCSYLGMTWGGFKHMMIRMRNGDPRNKEKSTFKQATPSLEQEILLRDGPTCSCCGINTRDLQHCLDDHWLYSRRDAYTRFMDRIGLPSNHRVFRYVGLDDSIPLKKKDSYKVFCAVCLASKFGFPEGGLTKRSCLIPVSGTYGSKRAIYRTVDVKRIRNERETNSWCKNNPSVAPLNLKPKPYFKLYLARSVHNIYANWCRTRDRKYKEHFPGVDLDTGKAWEDTLVDTCGPRQETMYALYEAVSAFFDGKGDQVASKYEELLSLVAKGLTPEEIVNRMKLSKRVLKVLSKLT